MFCRYIKGIFFKNMIVFEWVFYYFEGKYFDLGSVRFLLFDDV